MNNQLIIKTLKIFLLSITLLIADIFILSFLVSPYAELKKDDKVVRQYLMENVEKNRGGIWLYGSNETQYQFHPAREYMFMVGTEDILEVVVSQGKVVYSNELNKIPRSWFGTDSRFFSNEKWR